MLEAVVFDFDGVIVDSEPLHFKAFQEVMNADGVSFSWNEYVRDYMGFDDRDAFRTAYRAQKNEMLPEVKLRELIVRKAGVFEELIRGGHAYPFPGAVELIRDIAGKLPLALCSGALQSDILPILKTLELEDVFDVMVTAEDVHASKPDPASYLLAVERLKKKFPGKTGHAARCIAIEDTSEGIRSAKAAGLKVLAVTHSYEAHALSQADWIVDSFEALDLMHFRSLIAPDSAGIA